MADEFYIGYQPQAPAALGRRVRLVVALLFVLLLGASAALSSGHRRLGAASFEFGVERSFRGIVKERPFPLLMVLRPGLQRGVAEFSRYPLVAPGKFGAAELMAEVADEVVELRGTLIYRDGKTMIEVVPGSIESTGKIEAQAGIGMDPVDTVRLRGEIVDSKCFLGVMNPGDLRTHRPCAIRCLSGGIPPVLCVRDATGRATYFLLARPDLTSLNADILDRVAEPVEVFGQATRWGDLDILLTRASDIRRLSAGD